jgi:hypothetical protein
LAAFWSRRQGISGRRASGLGITDEALLPLRFAGQRIYSSFSQFSLKLLALLGPPLTRCCGIPRESRACPHSLSFLATQDPHLPRLVRAGNPADCHWPRHAMTSAEDRSSRAPPATGCAQPILCHMQSLVAFPRRFSAAVRTSECVGINRMAMIHSAPYSRGKLQGNVWLGPFNASRVPAPNPRRTGLWIAGGDVAGNGSLRCRYLVGPDNGHDGHPCPSGNYTYPGLAMRRKTEGHVPRIRAPAEPAKPQEWQRAKVQVPLYDVPGSHVIAEDSPSRAGP